VPEELLPAIAAIENHSVHPLAGAVVEYFQNTLSEAASAEKSLSSLQITDLEETAGEGVSAKADGVRYRIGKPGDPNSYQDLMSQGYTVIEVDSEGENVGWMAVSDPIKKEAAAALRSLREMGISTVMLTGDSELTAKTVAAEVGIDQVIAGLSPDRKAELVRKFRSEGRHVGMVGDGINDAAALKTADVGIAVGSGTDLSIESADIILIHDSLESLPTAIRISRLTVRTIKQNLFWAFFYNLAALPLAALAFLHPIIAEAAMLFSSINVILNSLKITRGGKKDATSIQRP